MSPSKHVTAVVPRTASSSHCTFNLVNILLSLVLAAGDRKLSKSSCGLLSAAAPDERIHRRKVQGLHIVFVLVVLHPSRQRRAPKVILRNCFRLPFHTVA